MMVGKLSWLLWCWPVRSLQLGQPQGVVSDTMILKWCSTIVIIWTTAKTIVWNHCEHIVKSFPKICSVCWAGICAAESVFTCHEETSRVEFWKSQVSRRAKWAQLRAKYWSTNSIPPTELVTLTQDLTSDSGRWPGHNGLNLHRIRQRRV